MSGQFITHTKSKSNQVLCQFGNMAHSHLGAPGWVLASTYDFLSHMRIVDDFVGHQLFTQTTSAACELLLLRLPLSRLSLSRPTPLFSPFVKPTHHGTVCDHMRYHLLIYPSCQRQQVLITKDDTHCALWYHTMVCEHDGGGDALPDLGNIPPSKQFIYSLSYTPDMGIVNYFPCCFSLNRMCAYWK